MREAMISSQTREKTDQHLEPSPAGMTMREWRTPAASSEASTVGR